MKVLESLSPLLPQQTGRQKIFWLGAVSFEARCIGSVDALLKDGFEITKAVAFDYPTKLSPTNTGEQRRAANRREFSRLLGSSLEFRPMNPYSYAEFIGELSRLMKQVNRR